jgi:hypothetical protein
MNHRVTITKFPKLPPLHSKLPLNPKNKLHIACGRKNFMLSFPLSTTLVSALMTFGSLFRFALQIIFLIFLMG